MPGKYKSEEIRKLIVEAKIKGELGKDIAARFHVHEQTVKNIWKRWKESQTVKHKKIPVRPRKTTPRQRRLLVRLVKKDPFMTLSFRYKGFLPLLYMERFSKEFMHIIFFSTC